MSDPSTPESMDEAIDWLMRDLPRDQLREIADMSKDDAVGLHRSLGMYIRNNLGLWGDTEKLCASMGLRRRVPAEYLSGPIIEQLWERLQKHPDYKWKPANKSADWCLLCGISAASALTRAHAHDGVPGHPDRTFKLCWTCHRLYDHDVVSSEEVLRAEQACHGGQRPDATAWFRRVEADLLDGERAVNKARQHKNAQIRAGLTVRLRNRAKKAWRTRKENESRLVKAV